MFGVFMYDGKFSTSGWRKCEINRERLSVEPSKQETIGQSGLPGLWIFERPWKIGVFGGLFGMRYLAV